MMNHQSSISNHLNQHSTLENYSPTINPVTFALILQLATMTHMKKKTADTVAAFPYQSYPKSKTTLITKLDPIIAEVCNIDPDQEYQIVKYIYGLPDASRAYYNAYSTHLQDNGYRKSSYDPCLFFCINDQELNN